MKNKKVIIFDNGGRTCDRYTCILTTTGDVIGFNDTPFHPAYGFGQFCGNVTDRMNVTFGYGWRNHFSEKRILKIELAHYLKEARANENWLGKEINLLDLTEQAQAYVNQTVKG